MLVVDLNSVESIPISWIVINNNAFALCGYNNSIMGLRDSNDIGVIVIQDLYHETTTNGVKCEEQHHCLNYECEYNPAKDTKTAIWNILTKDYHFKESDAKHFIREAFPTNKEVKSFEDNLKYVEGLAKANGLKPSKENLMYIMQTSE